MINRMRYSATTPKEKDTKFSEQSQKFIEAARELGCDEDESVVACAMLKNGALFNLKNPSLNDGESKSVNRPSRCTG